MNKTNSNKWIKVVALGAIEAILISQVPRVLTHTSNGDLHRLYLSRSLSYWIFIAIYLCSSIFVAFLITLTITNRPTAWITDPITRERRFSWFKVCFKIAFTLLLVCIPEVVARGWFISLYKAPKTLLIPFSERFDQNMAVYGFTQRADRLVAQNDIVAFRNAQFEYRPYVGFSPLPGFRPMPSPEKKAFRVFFIGGSVMENSARSAVRDVEQDLIRRGCKVEIINAGRSAYVTGQEVILTLMELVPLQPDLVIAFDGYNDISRVEEGEAPGHPEYTRAMEASFRQGLDVYHSLLNDIAQRSFLVQLPKKENRVLRQADPTGDEQAYDKAIEIYSSNIQKMSRLANAFGYGLIVAIQPAIFFKDHPGPSETTLISKNHDRERLYHHYYPRLIARAKAMAEQERISFRDLSRMFKDTHDDVFYDSAHFDGDNPTARNTVRREFENMIESYPGACPRVNVSRNSLQRNPVRDTNGE